MRQGRRSARGRPLRRPGPAALHNVLLTFLYLLWAWLFIALGLTFSILGPAIPELRDDFTLPLASAGVLFVAHSLGYFGGVLLAGGLADARGRKLVTGSGAAALAAGMTLAAISPSWPLVLLSMVFAGGGFAFVDVGLNAAIGDAVTGAGRRAAAMNLLHGAFPIGTLVAPAGLSLALTLGHGWRAVFVATAAAAAASLLGFLPGTAAWPRSHAASPEGDRGAVHPDDAPRQHALAGPANLLRVVREPYLRSLAALQGLYVGVEAGIAGWLASYLVGQFGASPANAALATSAYWAGFLVGRFVMAYATHRYGPHRLLPWMCVASLATAIAGVSVPTPLLAAAAYAAAGLALAGIFPTVMALALEGRRADAGAATALITAAASLGGLIFPWLFGVVAQAAGLRAAMAGTAVPLIAMLFLARTANAHHAAGTAPVELQPIAP